jgi:AcrR family transcriptional regulator
VEAPKRSRGIARRRQIAQITLALIAREGIAGVRLDQISGELGVTNAALYKHFPSREDILIGAYDLLVERVYAWLAGCSGATALERLRSVGETHASVLSQDLDGFSIPISQFNAWIPRDRIHEHVDNTHRVFRHRLGRIVEDGVAEGCVRPDVDVDGVVSEIYAWIWWEDQSHLRGLDSRRLAAGSTRMFARIMADISGDC